MGESSFSRGRHGLIRRPFTLGLAIALPGSWVFAQAPEPTREHAWLEQFVGEWEYDMEAPLEPGKPPVKITGMEHVRKVGFWVVSESRAMLFDSPFTGILTLGFDDEKKKYVGTWIDSMQSHLFQYEGTVDTAGKSLTLLTEGPNPAVAGKRCKFKEVLELKDKDHKVFTSSMQGDDGKWVTLVTVSYRRKK